MILVPRLKVVTTMELKKEWKRERNEDKKTKDSFDKAGWALKEGFR